jgi:hypothetical protein
MSDELQQTILRSLRLVNGLIAIVYLSGFTWMLAQLYKMFT